MFILIRNVHNAKYTFTLKQRPKMISLNITIGQEPFFNMNNRKSTMFKKYKKKSL